MQSEATLAKARFSKNRGGFTPRYGEIIENDK
jgi:hypothetical protein